jgi:predicted Zn-dependent protease with MMP-like domain
MRQAEFEAIAAAAMDELPAKLLNALENVVVTVENVPNADDLAEAGLEPHEEIYGLYVGIPLTQRTTGYTMVVPDRITLYKVPLERDFRDSDELRAQIRRTVLHEIGHAYGMDEQALEKRGFD